VRPLFQRFLKDGWKIALASSAKGDELQTYKEMTQITDLLETETSSDDAEKSKPHPDIFLAALERLGEGSGDLQPHECLIVGDSPYDAEAASKAGIPAIGLLCGGFKLNELEQAGYKAIYQDPADLLHNFENFTRTTAPEPLS
jgi:phosphoglycolate phosphatase-like HAD superfamily hydrolase